MSESRTINSIRNFAVNFLNRGISLIIKFGLRTVFIYTLSQEYLGINGLFSNILTLLSLADLGFGLALPYSLYKPLKEKDESRIQAIMAFYSRVYLIVGTVVLLIGLSISPFLKVFIKGGETIPNLKLIYALFVINSSVSYLFIYKRTLITADQKDYLVTSIDAFMQFVIAGCQILVLLIFHNYIAYLILQILGTICTNLLISHQCDSIFPFLKEKSNIKLSHSDIGRTRKDIYALMLYKIASAVETGTDNIIVSTFIGIIAVGTLSNYTLIIQSVQQILQIMFSSMTASIGNLIVSESKKHTYQVYRALNFVSFWFYGVVSVCMLVLIQPFVGNIWLNDEFLVEYKVAAMLIINFYICGTQNMNSSFRNAYGLFWQARYRPVLMVIVNIVSSIILVKTIGLIGVFIGTALSRIFTVGLMDPYVVHKYGLKENVRQYHIDYILYFICMIAGFFIVNYALMWLRPTSLILWVIKGVFSVVLINVLFVILFFRTDRFQYLKSTIIGIFTRKNA